jgi:hypothetical protein
MSTASSLKRQVKKQLRTPAGCEGYLTRRQAASALGLASEYKIRQFEREGVLRSVRGPMQTAFYPRAEILALKARLALTEPDTTKRNGWTDAELVALLSHQTADGRNRTALDLVMETQIEIERAERVYAFWSKCQPAHALNAPNQLHTTLLCETMSACESVPGAERRSNCRLSRDALIRKLRDPDPKVRQQAFLRLREDQT